MLGSISDRFRGLGALTWGGLLAIGLIACAASTAVSPDLSAQNGAIADVRVEREGEATVVTLLGLDHPIFTAFAQEGPDRVVVDLASVHPQRVMDPIAVYDGLVEEIALSPFSTGTGDPMLRVEISLAMASDYDVVPTDEGLAIRVEALAEAVLAESPQLGETTETAIDEDPWAVTPTAASDLAPPAPPSWEAPAATALSEVEVQEAGEGCLIHLLADGTVSSAVTFTLQDPQRLVIDLPEMVSSVSNKRIDVGSSRAARVRVGQHAGMVRVVIDAGDAPDPFENRRIVPAPDGLLVALGAGHALDWALNEAIVSGAQVAFDDEPAPEAPETALGAEETPAETGEVTEIAGAGLEIPAESDQPAAEIADEVVAELEPQAAEATVPEVEATHETVAQVEPATAEQASPVVIYGVEFDAQETRDRVVVVGAEPVHYLVYEPDPETVVLSIEGATIDPEAAVRVAPEAGGPVSLVTAFAQPDTPNPEVRVVVKRAAGLAPEVSRRGSILVLDFPRTGGVAVTPPVLAATPSEPVLSQPAQETTLVPAAGETVAQAPAPQLAEMTMAAVPAAPAPPAAAAAPASLEPPAAISILNEGGLMDGKQYSGRRISLDFKDVEVADVLRLIAEVSDLNVIAGDEVKGRVTIRLVDVPWDQALDVILLSKGLGFMRVGNVLRIASADVLAREEEVRLQERRAKEKLEDLVVKLQPVNYAAVGDISGMVTQLLSPRGSVNVDKRTNTLIMKDIPSVIDEATALIKAIDTQTPQVMIEAKIVEANLDFSREFGSVWGFGAQPLVDGFDTGSGVRTDMGADDFLLNTNASNNVTFWNPLTAGPTALWNLGAFILDEKLNLDVQLQAAEVNGDGKVISSPRVVTLDNTNATIEQGVSIPFQTFENGDAQLEFVDAVLALKVTPHITANRSIIMDIEVSRNAPDDSVFTLTGSPAIAKNQVQTETLVKDGQTLVIGGIYVIDTATRQSRVPYLHQIPILGAAFRSDEFSDNRKELLVFVTPRVVVTQVAAQ